MHEDEELDDRIPATIEIIEKCTVDVSPPKMLSLSLSLSFSFSLTHPHGSLFNNNYIDYAA